MTKRERIELSARLSEIADKLEAAETESETRAKDDAAAAGNKYPHQPFQVGWLCSENRSRARDLRALVDMLGRIR